jgi:hypothetical protein
MRYVNREVQMPAQPLAPSADEPSHDHRHTADHEVFDEDGLREDQPYAELEDDPDTYSTPHSSDSEGGGSW